MTYESVTYEITNGVATITLNRPEALNAITLELARDWRTALHEAWRDEQVRCIVITGAGRGFCAGADLRTIQSKPIGDLLRQDYHPILKLITETPKPVLAAINGAAVGAGANFALACDMRHMADNASFGEVFVRIGVIPDSGGHYFLPRIVGAAKAFELMATGEIIKADEAHRLGLVNRVFSAEELMPRTQEFAERLAQAPSLVLGMIKQGLRHTFAQDLDTVLDFEASGQERVSHSEDFQEGIQSFLEKRPPRFKGR
ncbi:MAG TPA: enoyl-CoA hydratase-related protein [Steroidobacteraceae bacterium]|nr:enoyl-CoA hydratase-related protein [Steroidobacteraceae bacterium]